MKRLSQRLNTVFEVEKSSSTNEILRGIAQTIEANQALKRKNRKTPSATPSPSPSTTSDSSTGHSLSLVKTSREECSKSGNESGKNSRDPGDQKSLAQEWMKRGLKEEDKGANQMAIPSASDTLGSVPDLAHRRKFVDKSSIMHSGRNVHVEPGYFTVGCTKILYLL